MADLTKTVEIIFNATDKTGTALNSIGKNTESFGRAVQDASKPLADLAKSLEITEAALAGIATAFGAVALDNFAKFQTSSLDLKRVLDSTDPSLKQIQETASQIGSTFGVSTTKVIDGVTEFKKAGFSAAEAAKLQKDALELMTVGDVDAAKATDILIKAIKGFGISVDEVPRFTEALLNVANKYAVSVDQISEGTSRLSPIAKQLGFSFEETTGLLTPVIEIFGSGSEAADGLRTGLLKLIDNSKPVVTALEQLGISQTKANGELKSGRDIYFEVAQAFQGLNEEQKLFFTQQLVGIEQAPKLAIAFSRFNQVQEATATAMEKTGSVTKTMAIIMDSLEFNVKRNAVAWDNLSIAVGEKLSTGAVDSTKGLINLGNALTAATKAGSFDPIFKQIGLVNAGFAEFVNQIAKNLPEALAKVDFTKLTNSFGKLGDAFSGIFKGVDVTTPQGLAKAIQFIVDSIALLQNSVAGIVTAWTPFIRGAEGATKAITDLSSDTQKYIGVGLGVAQVFEKLGGILSFSGSTLGDFGKGLKFIAEVKAGTAIAQLVTELVKINSASVSSFSSILAIITKISPVAIIAAAAVAGIGAAAFEAVQKWREYDTIQDRIKSSTEGANKAHAANTQKLAEISQRTGVVVKDMKEFNKAVDDGLLVFDEASGKWIKAGTAIRDFDAEVKAVAKDNFDFEHSFDGLIDALGITSKVTGETVRDFDTLAEAEAAAADINSRTTNSYIRYNAGVFELHTSQKKLAESTTAVTDTTKKIAEETDKLTERQKIAIQHTNELEIKLLELASNERIKAMEFTAEIKVADIQAQAQQVVAAFDEIGLAIQATQAAQAEIFKSLTSGLGDKNIRGLDKEFLKDFARRQQEQAQQALDDQSKLIDAQVANLNARTESLNRGDALIQINADDLAPELQLVLKSLLEHIQIEANLEGLELLLP